MNGTVYAAAGTWETLLFAVTLNADSSPQGWIFRHWTFLSMWLHLASHAAWITECQQLSSVQGKVEWSSQESCLEFKEGHYTLFAIRYSILARKEALGNGSINQPIGWTTHLHVDFVDQATSGWWKTLLHSWLTGISPELWKIWILSHRFPFC